VSADDDAPTPEELREAEALARALEGDPQAAAPADVMPAVGLLRHARARGLDPARSQALGAKLRAEVAARPRGRRWLLWLLPPLVAAAAAGLLLVPMARSPSPAGIASRSRTAPALPRPSETLLAAQAAAARGDRGALDTLDREMRGYRRALFVSMAEGRR
jgi:hypothetical protein